MTKNVLKGFTLVEVLIFVSLMSMIFVTISSIMAVSLHNSKINESKILGTRYTEEAIEWIGGQKEIDWAVFSSSSNMGDYCLNVSLPTECTNADLSNCAGVTQTTCLTNDYTFGTPPIFKRSANLAYNSTNDTVEATVTVEWLDGNNTYQVPIKTVFAPLE